jgi:Kef-type K+ transport system membrane component KefB
MSGSRSYFFIKVSLLVSVILSLYCLNRAIPLGLAGSPERNKWFALFFVGIAVAIILTILYYIWRAKAEQTSDPSDVEMMTLQAYGKQLATKQKDNNSSN